MSRNTIETVMGGVVILIAAVFLWTAYGTAGIQSANGAKISAEFGAIGALNVGDDVRVSGIKVGKVIAADLNPKTFTAIVIMSIDDRVALPSDSSARITSVSLLGGSFVDVIPGFEDDTLADGGAIYDTRDPVSLTDILGKAVFSGSTANDNGN
ncbi:MAG: outer membrane lipid asymmetry maintenance protein MlaD [Candidatus Puniceispirillales bacterium WSBS_2018_MAG_OTU23]